MKLNIGPMEALCDEKIIICISGLPAFGKVKVSASMSLPWAPNTRFEAFAWFTADSQGNVDLAKQKPESGTYDYVDTMGLIASMKMVAGKYQDIARNISTNNSLFIDITAECEKEKECARLERLFKSPKVKSIKITDEFVGELFYAENTSNVTIVTLGGSDGNSDALSLISALLASHGFNVLSLAYFNEKGLPKRLAEIPLEYFERVFQWLEKSPITKGNEIYIHGTSKGGELALLLASRYPIVKKAVAFGPHAYCFQGLNFRNVSSWSYEGKSLPFIRLKNSILFGNMLDCFIKNMPFGFTHTYVRGLDTATNKEAARIKVENAKADILLIAGGKDNTWNTYDGCTVIMDALEKYNYKYYYNLLAYENAGHLFPLPYILPVEIVSSVRMAPRLTLTTGGVLKENALAQADSWEKTIEFFSNN